MTNEKNETTFEEMEGRVYELAFHLLPTIAEADVPVRFSELKSTIEKQGGTFISEDAPKLIKLAYKIAKTIKAEKKHYNDAYFGWVKFTIDPEKLELIEKDLKLYDPMLRYLIIKTVEENTMITSGVEGIMGKGTDSDDMSDDSGISTDLVDPIVDGTIVGEAVTANEAVKNKPTDETIVE